MNFPALIIAFFSDRITKGWAKRNLSEYETQTLYPGKLYLRRVRNYGFSGNVLSGRPELVRKATSFAMLISVVFAFLGLRKSPRLEKTAFSFILGGGLSNLTDRYADGYVTDFICFKSGEESGTKSGKVTVFNMADFFIFAGAAFLTVFSMLKKQ